MILPTWLGVFSCNCIKCQGCALFMMVKIRPEIQIIIFSKMSESEGTCPRIICLINSSRRNENPGGVLAVADDGGIVFS